MSGGGERFDDALADAAGGAGDEYGFGCVEVVGHVL
jgi:hypothetical protein